MWIIIWKNVYYSWSPWPGPRGCFRALSGCNGEPITHSARTAGQRAMAARRPMRQIPNISLRNSLARSALPTTAEMDLFYGARRGGGGGGWLNSLPVTEFSQFASCLGM